MTKFSVEGQNYELVDSRLTFGEAAALERVTGLTFGEIQQQGTERASIAVTQAFVWISMKRVRPELKFSDLDSLAIDEIEWEEQPPEAEPDPTQPADAEEPSPT